MDLIHCFRCLRLPCRVKISGKNRVKYRVKIVKKSAKNTRRVKKNSGKSTSRVKRNRGEIWSGKILDTRQIFSHFFPDFVFPDKVVINANTVLPRSEFIKNLNFVP